MAVDFAVPIERIQIQLRDRQSWSRYVGLSLNPASAVATPGAPNTNSGTCCSDDNAVDRGSDSTSRQ